MVTLITGAASSLGIGRATALALARPGAGLALCDVDGEELEETAELCADSGAEVATAIVDVSETESVERGVTTFAARFGQIDALVANAGIARRRPFVDITDREWNEVMETNLGGVWRCARAVLPGMMARRAGRVVSVSSLMGSPWGWSEHVHYSASKAAIEGLTRALAVEAGPFGVSVNAVAPHNLMAMSGRQYATQRNGDGAGASSSGTDSCRTCLPTAHLRQPSSRLASRPTEPRCSAASRLRFCRVHRIDKPVCW